MSLFDNIEPIYIPTLDYVKTKLNLAINISTENRFIEAMTILANLVQEMEPHIYDFEKEWILVLLYLALVDVTGYYKDYLKYALGRYIDRILTLDFPEPWCQLYYRVLNFLIVDT